MTRALVTGATGYVGGRLVGHLIGAGVEVGVTARNPDRSRFARGVAVHRADMLAEGSLEAIGAGYDAAFYLVHSMGRGGGGDYEQRDARAAANFARFARSAGIEQVVYLGGLGDRPRSPHLRSRLRVGEILRSEGPPLTWLRAGMVVGAGSESYRTLRYLVERLPVMLAPAWLTTPTQAIAIDDVLRYLAGSLQVPGARDREVQIGAPEILSYGAMLDRMADALGHRRRPRIPVPLLSPWLSSHWIGLVAPVDAGVARPLVEGLSTDTTVSDPSGMALYDIEPLGFDAALREAIEEERGAPAS
ncbi:MAG: NAD(P)H-binding protein [Solirubrobacteraceae bacterium]